MTDKSMRNKSSFAPRITQLDANEFDKEIRNVLSAHFLEISKHFKPGTLNSVRQEISLILDLLIFYYSVISKNATFGQQLLNLKYKELLTKKQIGLYALLNYIIPYMKNKYDNLSNSVSNTTVRKSVEKFEIFVKVCNFYNAVLFLRKGNYPTLVERLLKLNYISVNNINQTAGYNYMTRELLWHGFMELLVYVLPLINYKAIKRKFRRSFLTQSSLTKYEKTIIYNLDTKCVICEDFPNLPCQISMYCSHLACYYCIKSNLLADEKFMCPICGETNTVKDNLRFLKG